MEDEAAHVDWSELPSDLLIHVFTTLEIPDLLSCSAVCQSWNAHASSARRLGLVSAGNQQGPWILYPSSPPHSDSGRNDGDDTATLFRLFTNRVHRITSLPEPSFRSRYIIGCSHGWVVAADDRSELHLLNPVTRAQIELPPLMTLAPVRFVYRKNQEFVGHAIYKITPVTPDPDYQRWVPDYPAPATRFKLYNRAVLSADPSDANCIVVLIHNPSCQLSFARIGDTQWTWINLRYHCINYHDCIYSEEDGLLYALGRCGDLTTFDLSGPDPVMNFILDPFELHMHCTKYLAKAPWGDLLQVWRYHNVREDEESETYRVVVYKVDLPKQEIVRHSSSFFVSAMDFPLSVSPNCVYLGYDSAKSNAIPDKSILKEVLVFNMENGTLADISLALRSFSLGIPSPVWFRPSLSTGR